MPKDLNKATYMWALAIREGSKRALGNILNKYEEERNLVASAGSGNPMLH